MLKAIDKVYDFPASLHTAILQANPTAAKNIRILEALENRIEPLSDLQLFLIKQGVDITSLKEQMELEMALIDGALYSAISEGLCYLAGIEDEGDYSAQTQLLQTMEFSPADAYAALEYLVSIGQHSDILVKLDAVAQNYSLTPWQSAEHNNLRALYEMEAQSNYCYNFTALEMGVLENSLDSKFDAVAQKAATMLAHCNPSFTNDPIFGSAASGYRSVESSFVSAVDLQVNIYPNPALESFIVELPSVGHYRNYKLVDQLGQIAMEGVIADASQVLTVSVEKLAVGAYTIILHSNDPATSITSNIIKQ